jgi:hypothetical protein
MATGQGGILSALLLFAILFRLGLLQEPIFDAEYRRVNVAPEFISDIRTGTIYPNVATEFISDIRTGMTYPNVSN